MTSNAARLDNPHDHVFLGDHHARNEKRTWIIIAITTTMMVVEIVAGTLFGSMALVADGWHMSTHAAAMLVTAMAYYYARKNAHNSCFTFGTGKLGELTGFASAVLLGLIALLIGWESLVRLANPVPISFPQAIMVAVLGLAVNLLCAWLLRDDHAHHHHHGHGHDAHKDGHARDNNLRAAYLHILADALTSVLAILALILGSSFGWVWMDPVMGIVGGLIIASWSWGLIRDTGKVLLDYTSSNDHLPDAIRAAVETEHDEITDLHVWQLGPGHRAAIVSIRSHEQRQPAYYREKLFHLAELSHVTVEVERRP